MSVKLPTPQAQAFVICRDILRDVRSGEFVLIGPASSLRLPAFPALVCLSVYLHLNGGHGNYPVEFCLRDSEGQTVWSWQTGPLEHHDPLQSQQMAFHDLLIDFPAPGRYDLAFIVGDDEIAHQGLWVKLVGPPRR